MAKLEEEQEPDTKAQNEKNRKWKHVARYLMDDHTNVECYMKVLSSLNSAFTRQIMVAVRINRVKGPFLLNSKLE